MLITCKECGEKISSLRTFCPHCGCPLKRASQHKKLPNGFGQISRINRNLQNPYRRMITVGYKEDGRPLCKILKPKGYFATYNDRYQALMEYHRDPAGSTRMTMEELYEKWSAVHFPTVTKATAMGLERNWRYCASIYTTPVVSLKRSDVSRLIMTCQKEVNGKIFFPTDNVKKQLKILLGQILDYGMEIDILDKNVAKSVNLRLSENIKDPIHVSLTNEELSDLWGKERDIYEDMFLLSCYSGWRPGEVVLLKTADINFEDESFSGGIKTKNGKNRIVPIHHRVLPIVLKYYSKDSEYLFTVSGKNIQTYTYRSRLAQKMPGHYPHDARKTFVTLAKKYGVDEYAIKRIAGHSIQDLTERVYTDRSIGWLRQEIERIE